MNQSAPPFLPQTPSGAFLAFPLLDSERERERENTKRIVTRGGAAQQRGQNPITTPHNMKHLAAYLLLVLGGNDSPTAKDIKKVLDSVGIEADDDRIKKLLGEVKGKDLNDVCFSFFYLFFLPPLFSTFFSMPFALRGIC